MEIIVDIELGKVKDLLYIFKNYFLSMACIFREENVGKHITEDNVYKMTGYSKTDIISFTGAYARIGQELEILNFSGQYPILEVSIQTDEFQMVRKFNFGIGIIYNLHFMVDEELQGQRIGSNIFNEQVINAREAGFIKIKADAYRLDNYNGYYTWARLGFSMTDEFIEEFEQLMYDFALPYQDLASLVDDSGNKHFWEQHGFTFAGEFILDTNSVNSQILDAYMKNLN